MKDLPEQLLPSLLSLDIRGNCPNLKERCRKGGSYRPLVSHIPSKIMVGKISLKGKVRKSPKLK
ncbi:hypothetical protein R6Q57_006930 [Mikania cordata]